MADFGSEARSAIEFFFMVFESAREKREKLEGSLKYLEDLLKYVEPKENGDISLKKEYKDEFYTKYKMNEEEPYWLAFYRYALELERVIENI